MKESLRKIYKEKRALLSETDKKSKSVSAENLFLGSDIYDKSRCLMVYISHRNETETDEIIRCALNDKKKLVIPVTNEKTGEITPVFIDENTEYVKGAFGIKEPVTKLVCPKEDIDTILVPGVAFDKKGNRMGFGKGCYDMLLEDFGGIKVGFCYDFQIADKLPYSDYDISMDYIFCDKMIIDCRH